MCWFFFVPRRDEVLKTIKQTKNTFFGVLVFVKLAAVEDQLLWEAVRGDHDGEAFSFVSKPPCCLSGERQAVEHL